MAAWLAGALALLLWPNTASAQAVESRIYIGGLAGPYETRSENVTGTLSSAGITGGIRILPWFDVEVDVLRTTGTMRREYTGTSISFATSSSRPADSEFLVTRYITERTGGNTISIGAVFHPRVPWHRLSPRLFAGVASHRAEQRTVYEHVSLPPGLTLEQAHRALPQGDWQPRHFGGPSFGGSLAVALTRRVSVVPDLRYDYGSLGDEINNALRMSIRVLWHF
jgi:hypothetical protein